MFNFLMCFLILCMLFGVYVLVDIVLFLQGLGNEEEAMFDFREKHSHEKNDN